MVKGINTNIKEIDFSQIPTPYINTQAKNDIQSFINNVNNNVNNKENNLTIKISKKRDRSNTL